MGKAWRRESRGRRPTDHITGAFMDDADETEPPSESNEAAEADRPREKWSKKSNAAAARWADPEFRECTLAKRRATIAARKQPAAPAGAAPELSPADTLARQRRSASRKRFIDDEEGWMAERLAEGAEWRARLNNDEWKRERQKRRAEASARGYANRAKNRAAGPATEQPDESS